MYPSGLDGTIFSSRRDHLPANSSGAENPTPECDEWGHKCRIDPSKKLPPSEIAWLESEDARLHCALMEQRWWDPVADMLAIDKQHRSVVYPIHCEECGKWVADMMKRCATRGQRYPYAQIRTVKRRLLQPNQAETEITTTKSAGNMSHLIVNEKDLRECCCGWWRRGRCYVDELCAEKLTEPGWWGCVRAYAEAWGRHFHGCDCTHRLDEIFSLRYHDKRWIPNTD
ncbi:unnamed protein product [Amoebophrya sp. A25]|nr:unnamed protein product [Amoebophrya sp. A25]|eukprot:GSA25T00019926001.1